MSFSHDFFILFVKLKDSLYIQFDTIYVWYDNFSFNECFFSDFECIAVIPLEDRRTSNDVWYTTI